MSRVSDGENAVHKLAGAGRVARPGATPSAVSVRPQGPGDCRERGRVISSLRDDESVEGRSVSRPSKGKQGFSDSVADALTLGNQSTGNFMRR